MTKTGIQWTDEVWNPTTGCTRVSAGCDHCYAFQLHDQRHVAWKRGRFPDAPVQYHQPFSTVQLHEDRLTDPLHWRKPRRVFVNSMSDLFHEDVPDEFIDWVFAVMALTPHITYQILTKRPERMRAYVLWELRGYWPERQLGEAMARLKGDENFFLDWPLPNVWLGTSVEDQAAADKRIPDLLATPAAVRFISAEPMLGPVNLDRLWRHPVPYPIQQLAWIICGGESGPHARPFDIQWARSLRDQCKAAGVAFFMKQLGSKPMYPLGDQSAFSDGVALGDGHGASFRRDENHRRLGLACRFKDRHGADPAEWPEDLRVREFPEVLSC